MAPARDADGRAGRGPGLALGGRSDLPDGVPHGDVLYRPVGAGYYTAWRIERELSLTAFGLWSALSTGPITGRRHKARDARILLLYRPTARSKVAYWLIQTLSIIEKLL